MKIVKRLRSLRKKPNIKVRLLMTTGCIEYWLMLHYEMFVPSIQTVEEKRRIMAKLLTKVPDYEKGNLNATFKIAQNYPTAVRNAKKTVSNLLQSLNAPAFSSIMLSGSVTETRPVPSNAP